MRMIWCYLIAPTVTALQTLLELWHCRQECLKRVSEGKTSWHCIMTLYTTQRKQYVCWSDQSNHRVGSQPESGSEMRNLALSRNFVTLDISWLQTVEMIRMLKKQFRRQNTVGNMLVRKFSFAPNEAKIQLFKSHCYPFMDVHFGVIHSRTQLENLLSVIVTHSSVLLTSPDTPARVWHLRWMQLTISMWCSANLPTA